MAGHNDYGRWGEQKAAEYLQAKGYAICHRNWRIGHRDLDITAMSEDGQTLVIAEVKTRRNTDVADPGTSVDWRKIRNLAIAANAYVRRYNVNMDVRFDLITIVGSGDDAVITHIENAFLPPMR